MDAPLHGPFLGGTCHVHWPEEKGWLLLDQAMTTAFAEVNAVRLGMYGGGAVKR